MDKLPAALLLKTSSKDNFMATADVWTVLDLIVAEFTSDPMSVQCFDRLIVERAVELNTQHKQELPTLEEQPDIIYEVVHNTFATDHIDSTTSIVIAKSPAEALHKYNQVAKTRLEYPYCWNRAKIEDVHECETIR